MCRRSYYDNGNISTYTKGAYQTNNGGAVSGTTTSYTYNGDRMTKFGNQTCVYDAMGNPTTYLGKTATWKGRQLTSFNGNTFTYDGSIRQSNGLEFFYDYEGIAACRYNDQLYLYITDGQGNVIALIDTNGNEVVQYWYDAWGNHKVVDANGNEITSSNHLGNLNPFRYRGYYYDVETGLYFLQTRYYDPDTGRFLNRDSVNYADPQTINGLNLYSYCLNNPVEYVDPYGTTAWWEWLIGGLIVVGLAVGSIVTGGAVAAVLAGAAIGGAISYSTQTISGELNWGQFALDIGIGALTGAIGASGVSQATATVLGGLIGSGSSIASDLINGNSVNWGKAAISGIIGIAAGFLGGAGVKNIKGLAGSEKFFGASLNTPGITAFLLKNSKTFLLSAQYAGFVKAMAYYAGGTVLNYIAGLFI